MIIILRLVVLLFPLVCYGANTLKNIRIPDDQNYEYIDIPIAEGYSQFTKHITMSSSGDKRLRILDVHSAITKAAIKDLVDENCLRVILEANRNQDKGESEKIPRYHFDDSLICEGAAEIENWIEQIKLYRNSKGLQMILFGKIFHAIQDFYSHSNYLEEMIDRNEITKDYFLPVLDINKNNCEGIKKQYFTSFNHGEDAHSALLSKNSIPNSHLKDPRSHLHWNKDFHPIHDNHIASIYSRSSLKEFEKKTYFEIILKTQVEHTRKIFKSMDSYINKQAVCD